MSYIDGFIIPVEAAKRDDFIAHAEATDAFFIKHGATSVIEGWEDDVPDGTLTDFRKAVQIADGEKVVFSWIVWPDKGTRDAAFKALTDDAEMMAQSVPFDGKRMIYGGFVPLVEEHGTGGKLGYIDAFVAPISPAKHDAFVTMSTEGAKGFLGKGALFDFECWNDDVPHGTLTDFYRATKAEGDELPGLSFVGWPDKAARDKAWGEMMNEPPPAEMPFDGKRMFWGGFAPIVQLEA
jgi:uncharacterized protein YbaA (DUF1428 family)